MSDESQRFCDLGAEHLKREEPEEALQWYERAIREDPQNPTAWSGRGRACYHLGQLERAERCFRRAQRHLEAGLRQRPRRRGWWADDAGRAYLRVLHWRGLCRFWLGIYEDAARIFRKILKLVPFDPLEVRFLLGETWFRMGRLDRAIEVLEQAGEDPDALYNLGLAWFYKGDFVRSVNAFRRALLENMYVAARVARVRVPQDVPTCRGTHPRELDGREAAMEYTDRCGDLWFGRPLLQRWLKAIVRHPLVRADVEQHVDQVRRLAAGDLEAAEAARLEGANAVLRHGPRLARTDAIVARDVMKRIFRVAPDA